MKVESIKHLVLEDGGIRIIPRGYVARVLEQGLMKEIELVKYPDDIKYYMIERENEKDSEITTVLKKVLGAVSK